MYRHEIHTVTGEVVEVPTVDLVPDEAGDWIRFNLPNGSAYSFVKKNVSYFYTRKAY